MIRMAVAAALAAVLALSACASGNVERSFSQEQKPAPSAALSGMGPGSLTGDTVSRLR